jgi:hypothetical protein
MPPLRILVVLIAGALVAAPLNVLTARPGEAMTASPFDGSRRIVIIAAASAEAPLVREQRAELLGHAAGLDERDMVAFIALPGNRVEPVHGQAPAPTDVQDFLSRNPSSAAGPFTVLLVGKDGGVKLRSPGPVAAQELFALIDTMPMRRQEMRR